MLRKVITTVLPLLILLFPFTAFASETEVSATDYVGVYDGEAHTGVVNAPAGSSFKFSTDGKDYEDITKDWLDSITFTDVTRNKSGEVAGVKVDVKVRTNNGTFFTSFTVTISPREVELTSASAQRMYNGTPLSNGNVSVSKGSFPQGEEPDYDVTGSQTIVGSTENLFTYEFPTGVKESNYSITTVTGTLTVVESNALKVVAPANKEAFHDGNPHGDPALVYVDGAVADDVPILYSTDDGITWSDEVPQITEIGSLNVKAKASKEYYKDATVSYTLVVSEVVNTGDSGVFRWVLLAAVAMILAGALIVRKNPHKFRS